MSFVREKEQILRKYTQYSMVSELKNQDEMKAVFYGLIRDHFDEKAWVEVSKTSLKQIANNMAICLGGKADAYNILQNLDDKFYIIDGADGNHSKISRKFDENSLKPYIEHRYWDLKMNMEFCIAAGIPYEKVGFFSTNMMGIPWTYIRNVDYMTADFCLRYDLGPEHYYKLCKKIREAKEVDCQTRTKCTVLFRDNYEEFCKNVDAYLKSVPQDEISKSMLCEGFEQFALQNQEYLYGHYQRAVSSIYDMVHFPRSDWKHKTRYFKERKLNNEKIINKTVLIQQLVRTVLPWENRSIAVEKDLTDRIQKIFSAKTNQELVVKKRIDLYFKKMVPETAGIQTHMRCDMIRLLLMNGIYDIALINKKLKSYSFFELDPRLPFDFLVLGTLFLGTGIDVKDDEIENDPYELLSITTENIGG